VALIKLHRAIEEEDGDPLIPFFQWITIIYKLSDRHKTILLQKAIENNKHDWKDNPAAEIEAPIHEALLTVDEITKNQFISLLVKEILRNKMPTTYYVPIAEMSIAEMLQKIPKIWKECCSSGTTFPYRRNGNMKNKHTKYHGLHTHDIRKKVRFRMRLCYCCRQTGYQAKNCLSNTNTTTSKLKMTGTEYSM